jgi:hypothetical protein
MFITSGSVRWSNGYVESGTIILSRKENDITCGSFSFYAGLGGNERRFNFRDIKEFPEYCLLACEIGPLQLIFDNDEGKFELCLPSMG